MDPNLQWLAEYSGRYRPGSSSSHNNTVAISPQHRVCGETLRTLARIAFDCGDLEAASNLLKRLLAIEQASGGPGQLQLAKVNLSLAFMMHLQKRLDESETYYNEGIRIQEQELGPDHPELATSLEGLATVDINRQRYVQAEMLLKRACAGKSPDMAGRNPRPRGG